MEITTSMVVAALGVLSTVIGIVSTYKTLQGKFHDELEQEILRRIKLSDLDKKIKDGFTETEANIEGLDNRLRYEERERAKHERQMTDQLHKSAEILAAISIRMEHVEVDVKDLRKEVRYLHNNGPN